MIWFLAMAGLALAQQQPTTGHILFDVSPGAEIVVFPRSKPDVIELGLYRNRVPLEPQLEELRVPLVADIDALSVGSGTSFITIYVERDDVAIQTTTEGGQITFTLQPGRIAPSPPPPTPTLQGILENLDYRRPARPPNVALSPLRGDASASLPDPATLLLDIPPWFITTAETRYGLILRSTRASMANIDSYREVLTESEDPQEIEKARYRMANAYLALQMPREAGYYARKMLADPHDVPTEVAELLAAQSDIAARRWDEARKHCVTASEAGARTAETLRCLGVVSIATGYPSPSHVARALLVQSGAPNDHLLAIQLFQKDHRHKEVIEPLEQVIEALETPPPRAWLALGDALYMTLDLPGAMLAWSKVRPGDDIHPAARMRRRMGRLAEGTRADWAQEIPNLEALSERDGREGAEAAYLLGQIAQSQGDVHAAAGHYAAMWKDHRDLSLSADVPERLLTVCNERLNQLHRAERTVDEVAVFHGCWHKDLDLLSSSTETLERMAQVMSD
ncbi:MAG: hypothetical protein GWP91_23920, partial [Rhodobacterales bacterium]|nr:hypothetical protein [Rhodobacterales bacterium]